MNYPSFFSAILMILFSSLSYSASSAPQLDPGFPYGKVPEGNTCVINNLYATPETMLGSWAMIQAVESDIQNKVLPPMFTSSNDVVYAVGTAAVGDLLGIPNCSGGCNQLNGQCFALKFNNKNSSPKYMILQSVNIAANNNSVDIYMAGGGAGNFPGFCDQFWGAGVADWTKNIENYNSCDEYFNYNNITSHYAVSFGGKVWQAKDTLKNACEYASNTGFNKQNFSNVSILPVTCPTSLTQITGLKLDPNQVTAAGNKKLIPLNTLTDNNFLTDPITLSETTQMQDCKTPSSGYCNNIICPDKATPCVIPNYQASISAELTKPHFPPSYCQQHPEINGYCSWDNGRSAGSDYCSSTEAACKGCGNNPKWCACDKGKLVKCE